MNKQVDFIDNSPMKLAFEAHLEHYKAIRQEIIQWSGFQNNLVNFSIALTAGSLALFSIKTSEDLFVMNEYQFLLLVVSFLLSMITWASLEAEIHIHDGLEYSDRVLRHKVQELIGADLPAQFQVLKADIAEISRDQVGRTIFRGILVSGKFLVSYIPALAYLFVYLLSGNVLTEEPWLVHLLFIMAVAAAFVVPLALIFQIFSVSRHYWGKRRSHTAVSLEKTTDQGPIHEESKSST